MIIDFQPELVYNEHGEKIGVNLTLEQWAKVYPYAKPYIAGHLQEECENVLRFYLEQKSNTD